jgi:thimet oligopeptidase
VPAPLVRRAAAARHFLQGVQFARQHLFASYDLALYGARPAAPLPLWSAMEARTPLGHVEGTIFPAGFEHIASGYAAGYYGYLWSLVIAEDLRTAFAGRKLDPAVGRRYRDAVLSRGGEEAPGALLQRFLGRPTDSRAFFAALQEE